MEETFDDIRSYRDHEVSETLARLIKDPIVSNLLNRLLSENSKIIRIPALKDLRALYREPRWYRGLIVRP